MMAKEEFKSVLLKLVEEGRLKEAAELILETLWAPLLKLTEENARAISELRASVHDLKARSEENIKAISELRGSIQDLRSRFEESLKAMSELRGAIHDLKSRSEENLMAISELRASIQDLKSRSEENLKAISELRMAVAELRASLRAEADVRGGSIARLEGLITQVRLISGLRAWCSTYGLGLEEVPAEPYRVDAVIVGKRLIALVEVAKTGEEADICQLLEGARIYERMRGEKPNALVLYIYAEKPPASLVEEAKKHGIIVDNSPKRIASILAKLDEELLVNEPHGGPRELTELIDKIVREIEQGMSREGP